MAFRASPLFKLNHCLVVAYFAGILKKGKSSLFVLKYFSCLEISEDGLISEGHHKGPLEQTLFFFSPAQGCSRRQGVLAVCLAGAVNIAKARTIPLMQKRCSVLPFELPTL